MTPLISDEFHFHKVIFRVASPSACSFSGVLSDLLIFHSTAKTPIVADSLRYRY